MPSSDEHQGAEGDVEFVPAAAVARPPARAEITFQSTVPPLTLPPDSEGAKFTKRFDFKGTLKKPFAFADGFEEIPEEPDDVPDAEEARALPPPEAFRKVEFPVDRGKQWDDRFDARSLESQRAQIPMVKWVPYLLRGEEPPLRPLDQFSSREKQTDIAAWVSHPKKEVVTWAQFDNQAIPSKGLKAISALTTDSFNLEVLIMRNVGLKKVPQFKLLRRLKHLDFSKNAALNDLKGLSKFLIRAPFIETVLCIDTKVAQSPKFRPSVIATNVTMTLQNVNKEKIGINERLDAIARFGAKGVRGDLPNMRWDLNVSKLSAIQDMRPAMEWRPTTIKQIVLPDLGLQVFHVGECVSLVHLDLSGNMLTVVRGTGIEQCKKLEHLSLKDNNLGKAELRVLPFLSSLKVLLLSGNRALGASQNYRPSAIALTQHSLGTNFHPGLVQLDDDPVTSEERVQAMYKMDPKLPVDDVRWRINLIHYYGNRQVRTADYLARVTNLSISRARLNVADLSPMLSLEAVDLSYNNLKVVGGLEGLTRLKILNLFGNGRLDFKDVMPRLLKTNSLAQVGFGVEEKAHPHFAGNPKYRAKVLKDLIFNNPNLRFLDDKLITPLERVETLRSMGQESDLIERYRFELIVNVNCTMPWNRRYHFTEVGIGNQYEPKDITVLRRLNDCGLTSAACSFRAFKSLEELNLSGNKLTNIRDLLLFKLPKLRVLDVTRNQISTPIEELAADVDNLRSLEVLAIRDNPITAKNFFMARMKLIGHMQRMREVDCTLEVIDYGISLDERVDGWKATGGKDEEVEVMRYKAIMFLRAPRSTPTDQLTELDLSTGGLAHVDLSMFSQLKVLLLTENRLQKASALQGLKSCKRLRVLDLRRNEFSNLAEIPEIIARLPKLESLGLAGNKCMRGQGARDKLIGMLPQLHDDRCALRAIDGIEITVAEIVRSWKVSSTASADRIRWQVVLLRKFPVGVGDDDAGRSQIKELDLSGCELMLKDVSLQGFSNITKLSLKRNQIKKLDGAGIDTCEHLRELDLSDNPIKDFKDVTSVVNNLRRLTHLWMDGTPAWSGGNAKRAHEYNPESRVQFCSEVSRLHETGASLRYLNGYKILIRERAAAVQKLKLYDSKALEQFRLDLLAEDRKHDGKEDAFIDTNPVLDLSELGLVALTPVIARVKKNMPNLQKLVLRGNNLTDMADLRALLDVCFKLTALDIRNNNFKGDFAQLLRMLKTCPGLRLLWVDGCLRKNMAEPKKYAARVFKELPVLSEVDGNIHPHRQRVKHRFEEAKAVPVAKSESTSSSDDGSDSEELPGYGEDNDADTDSKKRHSKSHGKSAKLEPEGRKASAPAFPDRWGDDPKSKPGKKVKALTKTPDRWDPVAPDSSDTEELPTYEDEDDFSAAFVGGADDYLPKNYNSTIGRNYDLGKLTAALSQIKDDDNLREFSRTGTARGGWSDDEFQSSDDDIPDYDEGVSAPGRWD